MSEFNQVKYINNWQKENLERIAFTVPKGQREKIKELATKRGFKSTNAYLNDLIQKDIENEKNSHF